MALDNLTNHQATLNYEYFCYLQLLFGLACILPLLKSMHVLFKFAQFKNLFIYNRQCEPSMFCQGDVCNTFYDQTFKFIFDHLWGFKSWLEFDHENI